ncbi:MAG: futalosine hydrolase [Bacteroidota bacterium]
MINILLVSATSFETQACHSWLSTHCETTGPYQFKKGQTTIDLLISGVGLPITAFSMGSQLASRKYQFAIQAGIGGTLDKSIAIGEVVQIVSERFGDLGAEAADGSFLDLQDLGLMERESGIFSQSGQILNPLALTSKLPYTKCNGISVNRVSGSDSSIESLREKYPEAQIESMEGAAFFYACRFHQVPMLQLRSISNLVEERNRERWNIPLAISHLNQALITQLEEMLNP